LPLNVQRFSDSFSFFWSNVRRLVVFAGIVFPAAEDVPSAPSSIADDNMLAPRARDAFAFWERGSVNDGRSEFIFLRRLLRFCELPFEAKIFFPKGI
jgi:hypothetical protein